MIPKTETAFKSEGKRNSSQKLPSTYQTAKTGDAETVSALLAQFAPYAAGKGQTEEYEYKDVVGKVILKLAVLDNLFEFYQYTKETANFSYDTIPGLCYILDDCISELKTVV
jgi:hypothetical protein